MILSSLFNQPIMFFAWIIAIIIAITIHEFSHVAMAYLLGDPTGKRMGRLTLNPLSHLDFFGLLMLVIVGIGWGKPAPYNPNNFRHPKRDSILTALAGPASNIILLLIAGLLLKFIYPLIGLGPTNALGSFLYVLIIINTILAVFNLIPIPPLDGSKFLLNIIPDRYFNFKTKFQRNGPYFLLGLIILDNFLGVSILSGLFGLVINWVNHFFV